jgi:hypothetical protein
LTLGQRGHGRATFTVTLGLASTIVLALPSLAGPDSASAVLATLPSDELAVLREKKLVLLASGDDSTHVTGLVIFSQPVEHVMQLLAQTGRAGEYRPELESDRTIETYPDGTLQEEQIRILFNRITYFLRYRVDSGARRISWQLDPAHPSRLRQVDGYWELFDMGDDQTLGRFGVQVDVGAVPAFLQDYATRKSVPTTMENARRWIDSDGRWRP